MLPNKLKGNVSWNEYRKDTSVSPEFISLNAHDPKKDLKTIGPRVIFIAVTFGR